MRSIARALVVAGLVLTLGRAAAAEVGPPDPGGEVALAASAGGGEERDGLALAAHARLQTAGKLSLAAAFALIVAGVVMIEVDPYALAFGDWGFGLVGAGVGGLITSSFILGFSRPVHIDDHPLERRRLRNRNADGSAIGLIVGWSRTF
jgi:hypothetical protein